MKKDITDDKRNREERLNRMQRSRLITVTVILKSLLQNGPLKLTQIAQQTNLQINELKPNLNFLAKHELIKKEKSLGGETAIFSITQKGIKVPIFFGVEKQKTKITRKTQL